MITYIITYHVSTTSICYHDLSMIFPFAVMILILGLVVYPMGLDSRFVAHYCPGAGTYSSGQCFIGWAYMLAIMGTALSVFCPFLSQYTDMKLVDQGYV